MCQNPAIGTFGDRLLVLGLNALARAPQLDYFADGHRGAAMISAHQLCVENNLDSAARARITELIDINWAATPLCRPFPDEPPAPERVREIGDALAAGGSTLRQVGHNAIFAMLAIKAFRMVPKAATPRRIAGVVKLIKLFKPWHDDPADPKIKPPPFADSVAASRFVLREADAAIDRWVGYGQGFTGHMLTFGQALVELAAMGDAAWAESCREAFCKYVTITRRGPQPDSKKYGDHAPSELRPTAAEYWQRRGDRTVSIGHVFKYPYSYYNLLRRSRDAALQASIDAKAYHVF